MEIYIYVLIALIIYIFIITILLLKFGTLFVVSFFNETVKNLNEKPLYNPTDFSWTEEFRGNHNIILKEYMDYVKSRGKAPLHNKISPTGWCDKDDLWRTLFLRIYKRDTSLAPYFPVTMGLINKAPITLASFSILEPGAKLSPHTGVYSGVLRYHLGLIIPKNYEKCWLKVDGQILHWEKGKDLVFNDMFIHDVHNDTTEQRVVLFLDFQRNFEIPWLDIFNSILLYFVKSNDILDGVVNSVNSFHDIQ